MDYKQIYEKEWFSNSSKYILHIGDTNSGKTYQSIQRLKEVKSGQYLAPLRLLAYEIYEILDSDNIDCDLITGEDIIDNDSDISSRTIEMCDYSKEYDCVVIDECFMISDRDRGKNWLKAILQCKAKEIHIISNRESEKLICDILTKTNKEYEKNYYERKVPLEVSKIPFTKTDGLKNSIHIFFSRIDCLIEKYRMECQGHKVSIIYGSLPPEVKKEQMEKFKNGETDVVVSTDAIAMGINLPCDNIIFRDTTKFDGISRRKLTTTEIKQIGGRAGRYGLSDKGVIYGYNRKMHDFIRNKMNDMSKKPLKAYYGIDIELLKSMEGEDISEKLNTYGKIDLIPDNLKSKISMEKIDKYIDIIKKNRHIKSLYLEDAWNIINIPFDEKYHLLNSMIDSIKNDVPLLYKMKNVIINDVVSLKKAENTNKIIDSYLSFSNKYPQLVNNSCKRKIKEYKDEVVDKITTFLMDKKLSSIKKCIECGVNIGVQNRHAKCNSCHYDSFYYDDYYY